MRGADVKTGRLPHFNDAGAGATAAGMGQR